MKMDRNINANGRGKYALILMRNYPASGPSREAVEDALCTLADAGMLDYGEAGSPSEFFLIRLKDRFARSALLAYAAAANRTDPEWGAEVAAMSERAGDLSPHCKTPD